MNPCTLECSFTTDQQINDCFLFCFVFFIRPLTKMKLLKRHTVHALHVDALPKLVLVNTFDIMHNKRHLLA